uniref:histidine kinase n=1 Tax=uncultured organism TaxID=155900 RepID=M1Q1R3_9ZZZZ|nr:multi-sensor signal transduction histidine kinase [uncultured organism]
MVDDDLDLLGQAEIFLQKENSLLELETLKTPKKALGRLEDNNFDCIVSDYQMPGMDGLEFLEIVKEEKNLDVPFIIFTGHGREEVAIKALNLGANRYLQKGGDPKSQYSLLAESILQETKRKRTERELRRKEEKHRKVFNQSHDSMWMVNVKDDEFLYEEANPQYYEFSGLKEGEVVGKRLSEIYRPQIAEKIRKDYNKVLKKKESIEIEQELEFSEEKRYHLTTLSPILDSNGKVNKIIGTGKDITQRKKVEKELREKSKKFENIFYENPLGAFHYDEKGNITECNDKFVEMMGSNREDLLGFNLLDNLNNENLINEVRSSLEEGEGHYEGEYNSITGGKTSNGRVFLKGIRGKEGEINSGIAIVEDFTERKEMEEELERSKRKFKKFFDDLNSITFISKLNGDIIETNNKAIEELGYTKEEIEDMNIIEDLSTSNNTGEELKERNKKLKNGESISFEDELKRKDNTTFRVKAEVNPIILNGKVRSASINKKIEEKKRIKEKLETILVNSPNLVFEYDPKGNYQEIYTQNSDKLAASKEEMLGNNVSEFLPQNAANRIKDAIQKAIKTREPQKIIFELQSNGKKKYFSEHFTPIISKGKDNRVISISREITERRKIEEELEESVKKFKKLFNDAPEPMILLDEEDLILDANTRFEEEFGYNLEELKGRGINEIVVPERMLEEARMLDKKSEEGYTNYETIRKGRNREFHVSISATPVKIDGKTYKITTYKNIDKRKEAEKELKESKEKYQSLIENLNEIVYVLNKNAEIEYISPNIEEISGYSPSEVTGKRFTEFVHPDDLESRIENFMKVLSGEGEPTEYRFIDNDGEVRWVRTHARPITEKGNIVGIQGVLTDITDRKKAEEREEFLHSLLRHDVRNKTQTIQGYLQLLEELELTDQAQKYIKNARKGTENELDLIEKVRILREAEEEEIQDINFKKIIHRSLNSTKELAKDKGIKVKNQCRGDLGKVKAGPLLDEALSNILENAIQHSNCQEIRISSEKTEKEVICIIEDDGVGIPKEEKEKIFEKGHTTDKEKGTGLGMFLVKTLLDIYEGEIKVRDSDLGGARFDIHLQKA